jgi:ankyrin repeat protein
MNQSKSGIYLYKQIVDNNEEVIELKKCCVNLGKDLNGRKSNHKSDDKSDDSSNDSEMTQIYLNEWSTESYDSEENSLNQMRKQLNDLRVKTNSNSSKSNNKKKSKSKRRTCSQVFLKEKFNKSLDIELNDYLNDNEVFISQSLSCSQISSLVQQNGRFTYFPIVMNKNYLNETSILIKQNVECILNPLVSEENNSWRLLLKIINENMFAFRKSSIYSINLVQKLLSHYDWSQFEESFSNNNNNNSNNDLNHFKQMHIKFITVFMREIALKCYTKDNILTIISGSQLESNAWTFVSKLISVIIVETIRRSDDFSMAFIHFKLIIDLLKRDFEAFLRESNDYCNDIYRKERNQILGPVVVRLIWSTKTPNYLNSVLKHLISLIIKTIKVKNQLLLIELFKLFELCAESLRIGSGNVRPLISFGFNKSTLINELCQQLSSESFIQIENVEKLLSLTSTLSWAKLQFCTHIMTQFVDFKFASKQFQISLEMIICCFMTGEINRFKSNLSNKSNNESPLKPMQSTPKSYSLRKRSSFGLIGKSPVNSNKSWSKKNDYGENKLHIACKKGNNVKLKKLLQLSIDGFGCDPNETDNSGYSPLIEAAFHGHKSCIKELIDWEKLSNKKLNYELCSKYDKQTALHDTIENNFIECAQLIIESGGIHLLDIKRNDGKTPKDLIKSNQMKQMVEGMIRNQTQSSVKVNINSAEDAYIYVLTLTELIVSYIETIKIDHFVEVSQDLWPNLFNQLFGRDPNETDINCILEDIKALNTLPNIMKDFEKSFEPYPNVNDLISNLKLVIDSLLSQ